MSFQQLPERGHKWFGRFQYNGKRPSAYLHEWTRDKDDRATGREPANRKEAEAAYENFKAAVRSGKFYLPKNVDADMSVAQFVEYYKKNYYDRAATARDGQERTGHSDPAILNTITRYFGNTPLKTWDDKHTFVEFRDWLETTPIDVISRKRVNGVFTIIRKPSRRYRSPSTIRKYRVRLAHMCGWAVGYDLLSTNPFLKEKALQFFGGTRGIEAGRARGVTREEEATLFKACDQLEQEGERMRDRIEVAIVLGPRRGEMQRAQLKDIDFDAWEWTFPAYKTIDGKKVRNTKSRKKGQENGRTIDIPTPLQPIFKRARQTFGLKSDAFIFGDEAGHYVKSFKRAWLAVKQYARLDDATLTRKGQMTLHWHDLRGEAGTRMLDLAIAPATVADILGNTVAVLMKHYKGDLRKSMKHAASLIGGAR